MTSLLVIMTSEPVFLLLLNGVLGALVVWGYLRCRNSSDEVVKAANIAAMAIGAPIGLGLSFLGIFVVRLTPAVGHRLAGMVGLPNSMDAVTAGFGAGILFACGTVVLAVLVTWFGWWWGKR